MVRTDSWTRLLAKIAALAALLGMSAGAFSLVPVDNRLAAPLTGLGLLLLGGELFAELMERAGLPHLTGYLLAGIVLGPHGLDLVPATTVGGLTPINALALALIALSAGGELTMGVLRSSAKSLGAATVTQLAIVLPLAGAAFWWLGPNMPQFAQGSRGTLVAGALLWAVLSVSRSPAATFGLIAQFRPKGPLTQYAIAIVVAFDIIVLFLFALTIQVADGIASGRGQMGLGALRQVGDNLLGSVASGTMLGLIITGYFKFVGRQPILFLGVVAYAMAEFAAFFGYDMLLLFVVAGLIVANVSRSGGELLLEATSQGGRVAYVVFFALAGAHLDLGLLATIWPLALGLAAVRVLATWLAARACSWMASDEPVVRKYGWMPLVSQAGVTLGMGVVVANAFPNSFGPALQSLTVAVVGINELVGPILFKIALDRAGEKSRDLDEPLREAIEQPESEAA